MQEISPRKSDALLRFLALRINFCVPDAPLENSVDFRSALKEYWPGPTINDDKITSVAPSC